MKLIRNIIKVAMSNVTTILSGILIGFLVPKFLTVEDYGLYKTFTLYVSYLGLFQFGIVDGIVLRYGSKNYEELDRFRFRAYFKWTLIIQGVVSACFILAGMIINNEWGLISILLGINLLPSNYTGYYQQISQITQRFNEYSIRKILQSLFNVIVVLVFYAFYRRGKNISYLSYVITIIVANYALTIWYLHTYKDITIGKSDKLLSIKGDILLLIKEGIPLMVANLSSTLILLFDRQFVNFFFNTSDYAIYAFAYSMMSLVTVATSAVSTVIYPFLKRLNNEELKTKYDIFLVIITVFIFGAIAVYFPLSEFVKWFLPKYIDSIPIFRIIIPGVAVTSAIHVIMHNYYKTLGKNVIYFKKSLVVLAISAFTNLCAYLVFRSMESISIASIFTIIFWYLYANEGIDRECRCNTGKNILYIFLMIGMFYFSTFIGNSIFAFLIYLLVFIIFTYLFYKNTVQYFTSLIWRR